MLKKSRKQLALTASGVLLTAAIGVISGLPGYAANTAAVLNVNTACPTNLPDIYVSQKDDLLVDVNNNLGTPVTFSVPDIGIRTALIPGTDKTHMFDISAMPGNVVPYQILDANGCPITNGRIVITDVCELPALNLNLNTHYQAETKPQPVYYQKPAPQPKSDYVRGYW